MERKKYKNFKMVIYIPAAIVDRFTPEILQSDYEFLEHFLGVDKVYLETHRSEVYVDEKQINMVRDFFLSKGVEVSGGITTTIIDIPGCEPNKQRIFDTFCYNDPVFRKRLKEVSEYTAGLFDEIILDDYFFTNCTCRRCIEAKGDLDWVTYRRKLLKDVSENLVVGPAKTVNPKVKMIVKYPNWRESYHFTGYVPEEQENIFDMTYTGIETRSPRYTDQHLPEYLSYALSRYLSNAWPDRNGGGWYDTYQCWSVDRYLEQAYLTAFAKQKELTHYQWSDLIDNPFVGPMRIQLKKIDTMLSDTGNPCGVQVYLPYVSSGENHLEMRLGMLGLPIEPVNAFPAHASSILLTESALADKHVIEKLEKYVRNGGTAVITSGFLKSAGEKLYEAGITESKISDKKIVATRYHVTDDYAGYIEHQKGIVFPQLEHGNNASWSLVNAGDSDFHTSILLKTSYGDGKLFIFVVPDNSADLYEIPTDVMDVLKSILTNRNFVSGKIFSTFTYDDGSMILYRYVKSDVRPEKVTLRTGRAVTGLLDCETNKIIPIQIGTRCEDFINYTEYSAVCLLVPGKINKFRWVSGS